LFYHGGQACQGLRIDARIAAVRSAIVRYQAAIAAGIAFAAFGIFGALPVLLGLALQLHLDQDTTTAWFFAVSLTSGVVGIGLALVYREPYAFGFNIPAAILIGAAGAHYGWPALLGACVASGAVIVLGSLVGLGRASMRFLPLPLVMGMFAGSILRLATDAFAQLTGADPLIAAAAIVGYFGTKLATRDRVPPTAGALLVAVAATAMLQRIPADVPLAITGPRIALPAFDPGAIVTLVVPIVLVVVGTGNVQALGFLRAQGFRPPTERLTLLVGALTIVNAALGGTPAGMARVGAAIVGGPDAGPKRDRWIASVISSLVFIVVAILAVPVAALSFSLPRGLVTTVAGLAIVGSLLDALRVVFTSSLSYSAFFAMLIAFTPFAPLGLEAAFWSLVGGMALALVFERDALRRELVAAAAR
jgi:benzoate membrane transport protein